MNTWEVQISVFFEVGFRHINCSVDAYLFHQWKTAGAKSETV